MRTHPKMLSMQENLGKSSCSPTKSVCQLLMHSIMMSSDDENGGDDDDDDDGVVREDVKL